MTDNFPAFAKLVAARFQELTKSPDVFVTNVDGDALYATYLASFPKGTNTIFKKATEHECSTCKHFIRRAGNVVTIDGGQVKTVWDTAAEKAPFPYDVIAKKLREAVVEANVSDLYRVSEKEFSFGSQHSHSTDAETGKALTWDHFYTGEIPRNLRVASPDAIRGEYRTTVQVFERGLSELSREAVETVLALIEANNLYRGEEHKKAVMQFQKAQLDYQALPFGHETNLFAWANAHGPASRFRNTVIGTLVQDLSEGKDVEAAVKSFETKVAPTNYKRTSAVITPAMVKKAMETIQSLGLESALERRFAVIGDISVNDVKWVDGSVKHHMKGGIEDVLMKHAVTSTEADEKRAEDITLDAFMKNIVPEATGMEVLFKGEHLGNLMSLTAPVHPEPKHLFKWDNDFAWSYAGNVADSIAERVKKAGGKVEGATLRVSLSWFNYDDLDLHVVEPQPPANRAIYGMINEIYFRNKRGWTGGLLDVDMNAGVGTTREAVENIVWSREMPDGAYDIVVNNYAQREMSGVGFVVEIENAGRLSHYSFNKTVRNQEDIHVITLHMKGGVIDHVSAGNPAVTASNISQDKWGLKTEQYVKVNAVTLSPNYWGDNAVGNKHTFFILDGAKNDEPTRGIYNEFLNPRLEAHRKVFEVIGDKTKCQPTEGSLSGLGFSSTKPASFIVKVKQGKKQRLLNVKVGAKS